MDKLVVITGASGVLGRNLVATLAQAGDYEVLPLSRKGEGSAIQPGAGAGPSATGQFAGRVHPYMANDDFLKLGIQDWLALSNGKETILVHLAFARQSDFPALQSSLDFFYKVLEKAGTLHIHKVVNISSQSVYDPLRPSRAQEGDLLKPATLYGLAKAYSEYWLEGWADGLGAGLQTRGQAHAHGDCCGAGDDCGGAHNHDDCCGGDHDHRDCCCQDGDEHAHADDCCCHEGGEGPGAAAPAPAHNHAAAPTRDLEWTSIRLGSLIGPGYDNRLPLRLARAGRDQGCIKIQDQGSLFSFLDVQDAAEGLAAFLPTQDWDPVYNLGTDEIYSIDDMAQEALLYLLEEGVRADLDRETAAGPGHNNTLDSRAFYVKSGWQPRLQLADSLRRALKEDAHE